MGDSHGRLDVERPLGPRVGKGRAAPCVALAREATMGQPTPATLTGWGFRNWAAELSGLVDGCGPRQQVGWNWGAGKQPPAASGSRCLPHCPNRQRRLLSPDLLLCPGLPSGGDGIGPLQEEGNHRQHLLF